MAAGLGRIGGNARAYREPKQAERRSGMVGVGDSETRKVNIVPTACHIEFRWCLVDRDRGVSGALLLLIHRKTHTADRPFQCLECPKNFPTSTALRCHLTLHNSQSRPLPCIYCGRRFMDKTSLAKHEESGIRLTNNATCQKTFHHTTDLSVHKNHHYPDKKFDYREFNRLNNLQRHMLVHQQTAATEGNTEKALKGSNKTSLAKHEESHMPDEQRKYTCDTCQKTFHHITDFSMHKKHHR